MSRIQRVKFEFVESVPAQLQDGIVYISTRFATAMHKCCCGCGAEVVTPLSPAGWALTFNGETISLNPSIGNWALPCKSHYWIRGNRVIWARRWSEREIAGVRRKDHEAYEHLYTASTGSAPVEADNALIEGKTVSNWWARIKKWLS
jgi:hypothetical protein